MSAPARVSEVLYFPPVADEKFLANAIETLERLRAESELRQHNMLAALLQIAKDEAEDDLRTCAKTRSIGSRGPDRDDGAARMARKLAYRGGNPPQRTDSA